MTRVAEASAAAVNGLIVVSLAPATYSLMSTDVPTALLFRTALIAFPFALLAAWRTWVYARKRRESGNSGWTGVLESGACAFALTMIYLAPGIVSRPLDAPPYVLAYGVLVSLVGLLLGVTLRTVALAVLKLHDLFAGMRVAR